MAKFQITVDAVITKDGQPFAKNSLVYDNLDEEDVSLIEGIGLEALAKLQSLGAEKAEGKKEKKGR